MKSQANGLLEVARGLLTDVSLAYPHDKRDVVRDFERLALLVKERGIGVFLLDLPALEGQLIAALENGRLIAEGPSSKKVSAAIQVPRLFRGLWLRIFDSVGHLKSDADPNALFFLRSLLTLGKKLEVECSSARTKAVLGEYYHVEQHARTPTLSWSNDELGDDYTCSFSDLFDHSSTCEGSEQLSLWDFPGGRSESNPVNHAVFRRLERNFDAFAEAIGQFDVEGFLSSTRSWSDGIGFRHGPGAVSDQTSKEYKYDFPTWSDKLGAVFPFSRYGALDRSQAEKQGFEDCQTTFPFEAPEPEQVHEQGEAGSDQLVCHDSQIMAFPYYGGRGDELVDPVDQLSFIPHQPSLHEAPSRLIAVPKTAKGPRLIAAEPTAHQWCQQFIKRFLEERLLGLFGENFISFRNQGLSQVLVSKASLDKSLATVDLSSASDRLTCWVVERAFRRNKPLLRALHATRTRWVCDAVDKTVPPNYFIPKKFASQGTAVTFPIQSIIFLIIALTACGFEADGPEDFVCNNSFAKAIGRFRNKVRVFGDDIIIPVHGYDSLVMLLHTLGLKVNLTKSFVKGHFRESCGMDCFKGVNITPIKTTKLEATGPQSRQSLIDYSNNLFQAGLWNAAKAVESMIPRWVLSNLPVIGMGCGGVGLRSYSGIRHDHLRKRYSERYQRYEYRTYAITSRAKRVPTNTLSGVLQYITEAPSPIVKWVHGIPARPKTSDGLKWEPRYGTVSVKR
nr:MAG: hypothetical protein 3 [Leviviridae sp.]